jgi:hydrogenase/urease accessory protein HupE
VLSGMRLPVVLQLPDDVRNLKGPATQELADSFLTRYWIEAGPAGLAGKRIAFPGLQGTITDVLVRVEMLDGRSWTTIVHPSQPWVEITAAQTRMEVMGTFVVQGIRHILFGADHMLFVLGLLLIVKDRWMLLKTITAFTVAHSITLAIATLGYAEAPVLPLNAAIALSILFLGPEIVRSWRGETSFTIRHPWVVAFAFGLLHGFGFALRTYQRGTAQGRRTLFVLPAAWLFGSLLGLAASASNGNAIVSAVWFLLLGGLLAADAKLSLRVTTALAALLGLYHGYLNGAGLGLTFSSAAVLLGLIFSVFVMIALAAAFVLQLQASWARIAVRVAGSWIFASGLLLMGWAVRSGHGRPL